MNAGGGKIKRARERLHFFTLSSSRALLTLPMATSASLLLLPASPSAPSRARLSASNDSLNDSSARAADDSRARRAAERRAASAAAEEAS